MVDFAAVRLPISIVLPLVAACSGSAMDQDPDSGCSALEEHCGSIPADAEPCVDSSAWPLELASAKVPLTVHYSRHSHDEVAARSLSLLETAWRVEVDELGFSPPVADRGLCGFDDRYDVFLWADRVESYVEAIADNAATQHDDWITYMVLDPWGPYGGDRLASTIAHELNHALQASDDWWESPLVFEMTATFIEEVVFPDDNEYFFTLADFQARPDWSLDRSDDWETWYMYGASLYLQFVRDRYFGGDASFAARMWRQSRSLPDTLEPDFGDALAEILGDVGTTFADSVVAFARWRWYTGARDDGEHFSDGAQYPPEAEIAVAGTIDTGVGDYPLPIAPMAYGSVYLLVERGVSTPAAPLVSITNSDPDVRWMVEAVPGPDGTDGERFDISGGPQPLDLTEHGSRTLIVTAVPTQPYDPDTRTDRRFSATIRLE